MKIDFMKSSSFFLALLLVSAAAIFGCKSPTSVVSGASLKLGRKYFLH